MRTEFLKSGALLFSAMAILPSHVTAQDVLEFGSYGEAINFLVEPGGGLNIGMQVGGSLLGQSSCNGLVPALPNTSINDVDTATLEALPGVTPGSLTPPETGTLGPNLSLHCTVPDNFLSGSTISAGFNSVVPTRTFIPIAPTDERGQPAGGGTSEETPTSQALGLPDGFTQITLGGTQSILAVQLDITSTTSDVTEFQRAGSEASFSANATWLMPRGEATYWGVSFGFKRGSAEVLFTERDPDDAATGPTNDAARANAIFCNGAEDGEQGSQAIDLAFVGIGQLPNGIAVSGGIGAGFGSNRYENTHCFYTSGDVASRRFAGRLSGEQDYFRPHASVSVERPMEVRSIVVVPSLTIDASRMLISGYQENETPSALNDMGAVPLGTALIYEPQTQDALIARLGASAEFPFSTASYDGDFIVGAYYVHDFVQNITPVEARFVEDGRDDPTRFSFPTRAPQPDHIEVGLGVKMFQSSDGLSAGFVNASAILGDPDREAYQLSASWSRRF